MLCVVPEDGDTNSGKQGLFNTQQKEGSSLPREAISSIGVRITISQ